VEPLDRESGNWWRKASCNITTQVTGIFVRHPGKFGHIYTKNPGQIGGIHRAGGYNENIFHHRFAPKNNPASNSGPLVTRANTYTLLYLQAFLFG
jgi:hypothetical protein